MKNPILLALGAGLLVLVAAFSAPVWRMLQGPGEAAERRASVNARADAQGLPWQVQALPDGLSQVFGLVPGRDSLGLVVSQLGDGVQVAVVARLGEVGSLEALAEPFLAGFVSGRLVLAFDAPEGVLAGWRERSQKSAVMAEGLRRFALTGPDLAQAQSARLTGLSFVPTVRLSQDDLRQRFGAPAEVRPGMDGTVTLLYPALGLSATVAPGQRGLLQYVAPREFERRLRAPLGARSGAASGAASASAPAS